VVKRHPTLNHAQTCPGFCHSLHSLTFRRRHAQGHEIALTGGGLFASNQNFNVDASAAIEGSYAGRLAHMPLASIYGEVPLAWGFSNAATIANVPAALTRECSSFFFAPGLKLKLAPEFPLSPYLTVGVGLGRFHQSGKSDTTTVAQYGGGVDMKILPFVSLRGEVRDYNSGVPDFGLPASGRQHNVLVTGGLALRF